MVKVASIILGSVAAIVLLAAAGVYWASEARLRDVARGPDFDQPIPTDAASIEHGRHVARTRGCFGCHGQQLEGADFGEQWDWPERAVAPNLAAYAQANDAATIEAAVRQGIDRNARALISMPSYNFTRLTDEDMAALIALLQSAPVVEQKLPKPKLGWPVRWDFARGAEIHMVQMVALVPELKVDAAAEPQRARGEYMAMSMCNECHGLDVRGSTIWGVTPDLAIVAAYSREEFETLIESGVAPGGRELGLMGLVAPDRFPELSDDEVDDLYAYLTALVDEPVPENVMWRPSSQQ
ncbi:cytochrome c [Hyphococcus sp.]|uniref:cytochrome c n=1 Tax=Hyphococcus sp. TaxID=2038636 RepID=UPI0020831294|nr:MAG: hypothetical protein DHS20C04_25880 [Marinicaulis sp.]